MLHHLPSLAGPARAPLSAMATLLAGWLLCQPLWAAQDEAAAVTTQLHASTLEWTTAAPHGRATLRIAREGEAPRDIALPDRLAFSLQDHPLPDGLYTYELTLASTTTAVRKDDAAGAPSALAGPAGLTVPGHVSVRGGTFVLPPDTPPPGERAPLGATARSATAAPPPGGTRMALKDQVVAENYIAQGSACVGLDCVNNESFGVDTLRLKENNLRLKFEDTSSAPFPNNHWQLVANDSASGGASYFGIDDVTGSRAPVRWLAGAPAHSLHLDAQGRVGVRTAVPVLDLHVLSSNTPALRQEQSNTSGFTAQTWDVAGNEANFFVRDLTGGSRLPLRVRPGAPHASLDIAATGFIGLGTPRPSAPLHLRRSDGSASVLVQETNGTMQSRVLMELRNSAATTARLAHGHGGTEYWAATAAGSGLSFSPGGAAAALTVQANGNLALAGTLSQGSSRTLKHDIALAPVDAILGAVAQLPLYAWRYLNDDGARLHLGPMAEDVHQRMGLGNSPRTLAPGDVAGLAAAAAQALHLRLAAKDEELDALLRRLVALEQQLAHKAGDRP